MFAERRLVGIAACLVLACAILVCSKRAGAQACCAGATAVTPARLGLHDDALAGVQLEAASVFGSHDANGNYVPAPTGARECSLKQNLFAAIRWLERGQAALLVPFVETYRATSRQSEMGGGLGDVNLSVRYDLVLARESLLVPGIGFLAGVTLPTGRSVESANKPLATDATGLGSVQANAGLALEQVFGSWLLGVTGLVGYRVPSRVNGLRMQLSPQFSLHFSGAHIFENGASVALSLLYAVEGNARIDGATVPQSSRRLTQASLGVQWPLDDHLALLASVFSNAPISELGVNQNALAGAALGAKWAFL